MSTGWPPFRYCFSTTLQSGTVQLHSGTVFLKRCQVGAKIVPPQRKRAVLFSQTWLLRKKRPFSKTAPGWSHFGSTFFQYNYLPMPSRMERTNEILHYLLTSWYDNMLSRNSCSTVETLLLREREVFSSILAGVEAFFLCVFLFFFCFCFFWWGIVFKSKTLKA